MNKKFSKILALAMAFVLVLSLAGVALADETFSSASGYAYATDQVNVRSGPGASYSVLGYLSRGEKVTISGTVSNGWTQIKLPGSQLGYVSTTYLSSYYPDGNNYPVTLPSGTVFKVTTAALNVRSGPGTNYGVISVLKKGDRVTRIGQSGNWFKVSASNGADAWVSSKYLSSVDGSEVPVTPSSGTVYATTGVNVRSGPGTKYSIVGGLNRGDRVTKTGTSGNWTKISWGSNTGYVYTKYLQADSLSGGNNWTSGSTYTRYATTLLNVRSGPSTSYTLLGTIGQGQSVSCVGTVDGWTKIVWGSGYAYVSTGYLTSNYYGSTYPGCGWNNGWGSNVIYGSTAVQMQNEGCYYYYPNSYANNSVAGTLKSGTRLTLLGIESDNWARVQYNGGVYYVSASYLGYAS